MKTLTEWITPVINRTANDVRIAQTTKSDDDLKGALNRSDLIRVGTDIGIILELLGEETRFTHIYPNSSLYPSTTLYPGVITVDDSVESPVDVLYFPPEIPKQYEYYRVLREYIVLIRSYMYIYETTPAAPIRPYNLYTKWNNIERILRDTKEILDASNGAFTYSGNDEAFCNNYLI